MDLELDDRTALVFAGSKGLGRAAAAEIANEGAQVAIASRNADNLAAAKDHIVQTANVDTNKIQTYTCDLTIPSDIQETVQAVANDFDGLDILVTNHGGPPVQPIDETDVETLDQTYELVLRSTLIALQSALPLLVDGEKESSIINIVSATAAEPTAGDILQAAFRPGIYAISKSLAEEYGPKGVRVNCICPRGIVTDRLEDKIELLSDRENITVEKARKLRADELPLRKLGEPPSFGQAVAFLASPAADFITGETLALDGGWLDGMSP